MIFAFMFAAFLHFNPPPALINPASLLILSLRYLPKAQLTTYSLYFSTHGWRLVGMWC